MSTGWYFATTQILIKAICILLLVLLYPIIYYLPRAFTTRSADFLLYYLKSLIYKLKKKCRIVDKTISRGLFPSGAAIFYTLCTSPPSYQSIKKRIRSIPIMLLKFWVGTRFVTRIGKNMSPEGYSHAERKILFHSAHLLIHTNLLKKM